MTNDITITAEAAVIPSEYKPVLYLRTTNADYNSTKYRYFDTGFVPKSTTKAMIDVDVKASYTYGALFGVNNYLQTSPAFTLAAFYSTTNNGYAAWGNQTSIRLNQANLQYSPLSIGRHIAGIDSGVIHFVNPSGNDQTYTSTSTLATPWTANGNLVFSGVQESADVYRDAYFKIYGFKIWDNGTLVRNYVPCVRVSDNFTGYYDLVNQTFLTQKNTSNAERADCIPPYINVPNVLTGCKASLQTPLLTSGTTSMAVIDGTWTCEYTPSSGYTFNSDDAIFQVIINNENVTSEVATYDSTTDSWSVTLVAHWGDIISVTASPAEIVEVEYIQSTGASNIITNYVPTGTDIRILSKFNVVEYTDNTNYVGILACISIGDSYNQYRIIRNNTTNNAWLCNCGSKSGGAGTTVGFTLNEIQEVDMSHTRIIRNGNTVNMKTTQGSPNTSRFYVGGNKLTVKYWYVQIYDGETLVLDLVPTRIGTRACFKDNVSGEFLFPTGAAWTYQDKVALNMSNPNTINNTNPDNEEEEI